MYEIQVARVKLHVQLAQPNLYLNCKFQTSTKSMYEMYVTRVKLSNSFSSSKF